MSNIIGETGKSNDVWNYGSNYMLPNLNKRKLKNRFCQGRDEEKWFYIFPDRNKKAWFPDILWDKSRIFLEIKAFGQQVNKIFCSCGNQVWMNPHFTLLPLALYFLLIWNHLVNSYKWIVQTFPNPNSISGQKIIFLHVCFLYAAKYWIFSKLIKACDLDKDRMTQAWLGSTLFILKLVSVWFLLETALW